MTMQLAPLAPCHGLGEFTYSCGTCGKPTVWALRKMADGKPEVVRYALSCPHCRTQGMMSRRK